MKPKKIDIEIGQLTLTDIDSLYDTFQDMVETFKQLHYELIIFKIHDEINSFIAQQRKCLHSFQSIRNNKDLKKIEEMRNCCFLMFGPIARLEYVPGNSEVDIFPVVRQKGQEIEPIYEQQKFSEACSELEKIIKSIFKQLEEFQNKNIEVYIHGVEFRNNKYCFDEQDLINIETKLGEAVYLIGDRQIAKELHHKVLNTYNCITDFQQGNFPMLTYIFTQEVVAQELANALVEIRRKIAKNEGTQDDWNQVKLLFSRFIGIKVKQLALHLLYWIRQRDDDFEIFQKANNIKHLDVILHQPPIYLGICYLKVLGRQLANPGRYGQLSFYKWIETRFKDTADEKEILTLNDKFENILNKVDFPKRKEFDFSIGELMIELWYSSYQDDMEEQSLKKLFDQSWELVEITGQAAWISRRLETLRLEKQGKINHYQKYWDLIQDNRHLNQPAFFPESQGKTLATRKKIREEQNYEESLQRLAVARQLESEAKKKQVIRIILNILLAIILLTLTGATGI